MPERITSTSNARIKFLASLSNRSVRDDTGQYLIEGARIVARALDAGVQIDEVVVCRELAHPDEPEGLGRRAPVLEVGERAFRRFAYRRHPDGVIAVARQHATALEGLPLESGPVVVLVAQTIEKPGNLGAMLRTADAAGADAVVVADQATDLFNPNVVRASQGALFSVPVAVAGVAAVMRWASSAGIRLVAATPEADATYWDEDMSGRIGIVVGSEARGLDETWRGAAREVAIPMHGTSDSLNAATAAALLLYEAVRQRIG